MCLPQSYYVSQSNKMDLQVDKKKIGLVIPGMLFYQYFVILNPLRTISIDIADLI